MKGQFDVWKVLASILERKNLHDKDVKPVVNEIGKLAETGHFEVECRLRELKGRIRHRRIVRIYSYSTAAMVALVVGIVLFYWNIGGSVEDVPMVAENRNVSDEVELIVSGKDRISLPASGKTVVGQEGDVAVVEKGDACLSFKEETTEKIEEEPVAEEKVEYNVLRIPRKKNYKLELADGSCVYLNAETELLFPSRFGNKERKVILNYGEAYFEIAKNPDAPFKVEINQAELQVLGTSFNVNCYTEQVATTLVEGSLRVKSGEEEVVLVPGEQAMLAEKKIDVREVDLSLYTAWKDGLFVFRRLELEEILKTMQRWYDFEYFFKDDALRTKIFTGAIDRNKGKEEAFKAICKAVGITIKVSGNQVVLE